MEKWSANGKDVAGGLVMMSAAHPSVKNEEGESQKSGRLGSEVLGGICHNFRCFQGSFGFDWMWAWMQ